MSDGAASLSTEERIDVLRSLASQPVGNVVCLDESFGFCELPEAIAVLGFDIEGTDASVGQVLEAIPVAERAALLGALDEARRTGVGTAQVRFEQTDSLEVEDESPTGICIVDMTAELGVHVCVVGELVHTGLGLPALSEEILRPRRLVQIRDETGRFVEIDPLTEALLGWTADDMLWASSLDFIHPDDHERVIQSWMEMLAGLTGSRYRLRFKTSDGGWRWLEITNHNRLGDPDAGFVETEMVDVDDEMGALARVRAGERQFKTLTESLPVGVIQVDTDANLVFANEWIRRLADFNVAARSSRADLGRVHPDDRDVLTEAFLGAINDGAQTDFDLRIREAAANAERLCRVRVRPLRVDEEVFGAIASIEDRTESASLQSQLRVQASTDHLTGLPNRMALADDVQRFIDEVVERPSDDARSLAVLFIDLDGFKLVNDGLGHDAGDELLIEIGRRLRSTLRPDDLVARVGGDEFVVVCPWTPGLDEVAELAERILEQVHEPIIIAGTVASVACSIGVALHDRQPTTADVLVGNADLAMYEAKRAGGARWELYGEVLRDTMTRRFEVQRAIHDALRNEEFALFLQPVCDLETGDAVAAECLVRWHHPDRGLVLPAQFVPIAEESDLIVTLGRWILDEACRVTSRIVSDGRDDFRVSVNISRRQLAHDGFSSELFEFLDRHRLQPRHLVLEVTETVFVETDLAVMAVLEELAAEGIALALDDFGTGYSSLNHLRVMPVSMLKVDSSYTADLGLHAGTTAIMETMGELSRRLGLELVVEGIETQDQLDQVREMGFGLGQGFHLGRPGDEASFFELLGSVAERTADA